MVGTGRFELPTPRTPSECSTRLSHVPTWKDSAVTSRCSGGVRSDSTPIQRENRLLPGPFASPSARADEASAPTQTVRCCFAAVGIKDKLEACREGCGLPE